MADKEFKTITEQIALLQSRGLSIPDKAVAEEFLLRNNYYRVSGYSLTLRKHDTFYPNASFQNIIDIYSFDYELRHVLLRYIDIIEVTVKSIYAYEFTKVHGATGYLDAALFTKTETRAEDKAKNDRIYRETIAKVNKQRDSRHKHEAYLKHFMDELHQDIPLWAYVDLFTISDISFLYSITEIEIKKTVARHFGLTTSKNHEILRDFLHSMTIVRNLCAHGNRLFNRLFEQKPSLSKQEKALLITDEKGIVDNAHLFGFVLIMRRLLTAKDFEALKQDIIGLTQKYPFVAMRYYGFRDDWKEKL